MKLYVNGTEKNITIRAWKGENWGEDIFAFLTEDHLTEGDEITEKQYEEEIKFWEEEIDDFNAGKPTETWGNPNDWEGWEDTAELGLDYE